MYCLIDVNLINDVISLSAVRGVEFDKLIAEGAKTGRVPKLGDVKMM